MSETKVHTLEDSFGCEFSKAEEAVLQYWSDIDAFKTSLEQSKDRPIYTFYDGPPFATGLPHYGHILAGSIKDIVTRYAHQTGHHVERRFGWDCHGLPVEYEIDKKLGIKSSSDVHAMGIDKYNEECRSIVMRYSSEWETIVTRLGRWIDFKNDYKTLDTPFMESVWHVFYQMAEKGLVYQGFKVMPYSTACKTPLSNFESGENYKEVQDPAVIVSFPLVSDPNTAFLAWTTTPWTLPSNLALCVHPDYEYVKVKDTKSNMNYIMGKERLCALYPEVKSKKKAKKDVVPNFKILETMKGSDLKGLKYVPLFEYFRSNEEKYDGTFTVLNDTYVTEDGGTMVVHNAPAFGEDDYRVCLAQNVISKGRDIPCPVDDDGNFTSDVTDFAGRYVKEADRDIIRYLKKNGRIIQDAVCSHTYPHCWRSDTPLIYKAVPSWFIDVPLIREQLIENNMKTYWVPNFVRENRFGDWLANARPWAVSRNRYWGTPMPIWQSEDGEETIYIKSIAHLKELADYQEEITDLHMHNIDHITIPSKRDGMPPLKRVPEVFDCWFESGSMPYGQAHYPFENEDKFMDGFPADFIAEGLDQTRGWFYTLMVISTALFNKPAFKNLIVNGLILASDRKKMSKRLKNYPDPQLLVNEYGADALRIYLINSPVVKAEPMCFDEKGVRGVVRDIFIPWYNSFKLFMDQVHKHKDIFVYDREIFSKTDNMMDKWILSALQTLIKFVRQEMAAYRLYTVIPKLLSFIDDLSKWYIRFNKDRIKGFLDEVNEMNSLNTMFEVLYNLCLLMAPFTPFLVERMFQSLRPYAFNKEDLCKENESVHYLMVPEYDDNKIDANVEHKIEVLRQIIELGRQARDKIANVSFRMPLPHVEISMRNQSMLELLQEPKMMDYIKNELNVKDIKITPDYSSLSTFVVKPNMRALGKRLGKLRGEIAKAITNFDQEQLARLDNEMPVEVETEEGNMVPVTHHDVELSCAFKGDEKLYQDSRHDNGWLLLMPRNPDERCKLEGCAREVMARVQKMRKESNLVTSDQIALTLRFVGDPVILQQALETNKDFMEKGLRCSIALTSVEVDVHEHEVGRVELGVFEDKIEIIMKKAPDGHLIA